jgi:hypothetical protein
VLFSGYFESNVADFVDVLADTFAIAVVVRASIVPAVLCGFALLESPPTVVTEELPLRAVVLVKFEFEFGPERPLAVPASVWHIVKFLLLILKLHRNVHGCRFQF